MSTRRSRGSTATAGSFWRPRAIAHSESTASVYGCPVASVYALRYPPDFALSLESRVSAAAAYAMSVETRIVRTMLSPLFGCSRAGTQHPSPRGCQGVRGCAPSALIRRMLTRKDQCFRDDHRLALAVDVHRDGSDLRVTAVGAVAELDALPSTVDGWPCNVGDIRSGRRHLPN